MVGGEVSVISYQLSIVGCVLCTSTALSVTVIGFGLLVFRCGFSVFID